MRCASSRLLLASGYTRFGNTHCGSNHPNFASRRSQPYGTPSSIALIIATSLCALPEHVRCVLHLRSDEEKSQILRYSEGRTEPIKCTRTMSNTASKSLPVSLSRSCFASLLVLLMMTASAGAQWAPGDGVRGVAGTVSSMISWDADDPGGAPAVLVDAQSAVSPEVRGHHSKLAARYLSVKPLPGCHSSVCRTLPVASVMVQVVKSVLAPSRDQVWVRPSFSR
jgi:hypothetical protein